jgi:beta-galactosidase/beta-glucuronidase
LYDEDRRFKQPSDIPGWPLTIEVPFPPESKASGIGDRGFHRMCWYQRDFHFERDAGRTILHFGAVDYSARVWVNGRAVASHEGGHTPFSADITSVLNDWANKR